MELKIELYKEDGLYKAFISEPQDDCPANFESDSPDGLGDIVGAAISSYAERCVKAELMEDGRTKLRLTDGSVVFLKDCYDIVGISGEHHSIEVYNEHGELCGTIENATIPDPEEIDDEFIDNVEVICFGNY